VTPSWPPWRSPERILSLLAEMAMNQRRAGADCVFYQEGKDRFDFKPVAR